MNKNAILAVALSTVVVMVSLFFNQKILKKTVSNVESSQTVLNENSVENTEIVEKTNQLKALSIVSSDKNVKEETIVVNTEKAEIILTNKGGDIISYKLKEHIDTDTKEGVQMVDNVSEFNKACSLSFGSIDNEIINEVFEINKIDEYTYLFKKAVSVEEKGVLKNIIVGKRYTFDPKDYMFKLDILIHNEDSENPLKTRYVLRTSPQIGPHFDSKLNKYETRQFISYNGKKSKKIMVGTKQFKEYEKSYLWNGIAGKYFVNLVCPENPELMANSYYSSVIEKDNYANAQAFLVRKQFDDVDINDSYYIYYGPRNEEELKIYNSENLNNWGLNNLKLTEALQSYGWLGWLETILKWILELIYKLIPNWGVAIILMTVLLKAVMFPITKNQSLSTLKMQEIQPKIKDIQDKYKDNPKKQQEMLAKVYQEAGYNPMSGCLPMILQFLILFAMYNLFNNYFEFRGASFIPNWIDDLSCGDSVYAFSRSIPLLGNHIRILPVIYLASQLFYGKITNNGGTANASTKMQMNMMMYGMPIVFFFIFYNAPAGLLLYWTISNVLQMGQQIVINKIMKEKRKELSKK